MTEKYFTVLFIYTHHIFLIHSSDDRHLAHVFKFFVHFFFYSIFFFLLLFSH